MVWEEDGSEDCRFDATIFSVPTVRLLAWPADAASGDERRRGAAYLLTMLADGWGREEARPRSRLMPPSAG